MRLCAPRPEEIPDLWPLIRGRVESCCERSGGKYEPVDVLSKFLNRSMDLWLALDEGGAIHALGITETVSYPRIKVCRFLACTGDDSTQWTWMIDALEAWARSQGCAVMEPICRPGWQRFLSKHGYKTTHVQMEKQL